MNYVDLLLHEIQKATTEERLMYLEDDISMGMGLGDIPDKKDRRFLKLALQTRYSYIIFKDVLRELERITEFDGCRLELVKDFEEKVDEMQESHTILLQD